MKNKKYLFLLLIIPVLVIFISRTFSLPYTEEIKSVEIQSNDYNNPGSWHIDKSAEWTDFGKARVTFDVNSVLKTKEGRYKDVIFVIDISGSMGGNKLDRAKQDAIELTSYLLSDSHNRVALITFDTNSEVVSGFTNNIDQMSNYIEGLTDRDCTNYNSGLLNIDSIMDGYVQDSNKDLIVLFLTDGYPNEDVPNQNSTYQLLKDKYPYMTINGIQYEMGTNIIQEIVDISDNQFVADQSTLNNVLFDATVVPIKYDKFIITDYINDDYFYIESVNDVEVPFGDVSIENNGGSQKVIWDMSNNYITGRNVQMHINLKLKEEYRETKGLYPTNTRETVVSKFSEENEKTVTSEETPVLKNSYDVIYEVNTPEGCNLPSIEKEEHYVYQTVTKRNDVLTCPGYVFKGWYIDSEDFQDVQLINDDKFIMPSHDVIIRGTWTTHEFAKTMEGKVYERVTLYKILEDAAKDGKYAKEFTGNHQDSMNSANSTEKIYYWYGSNEDNATDILNMFNVLFANHCWQMLRTTDTGGVKLIYNGEPENGKCLNNRNDHPGYLGYNTISLVGTNYYYGTDYLYDSTNSTFSISGTKEQISYSESNINNFEGKYTCMSTNENDTCQTIYFIGYYDDSLNKHAALLIGTSSNYSQFGRLPYNKGGSSLAYAGYMYNSVYLNHEKTTKTEEMLINYTINNSYWFAHNVTWNSPVSNHYNLNDPYQVTSEEEYPNLVGEYTFMSTNSSETRSYVFYNVAYDNNRLYYIQLESNNDLSYYNYSYTYGDSFVQNNDGTYTISNPTTFYRSEWLDHYTSIKNKVVCKNAVNNSCNELWYVVSTYPGTMSYLEVSNVKYASGFTWDGNKYVLNDDSVTIWNVTDSNNKESLIKHRYTCWNLTGECEQISYIYSFSETSQRYVDISGGKNINEAVNAMLYNDDVNLKDSIIKMGVEAWYKHALSDYEEYIDDVIFCNGRGQSNESTNGFNPNSQTLSYLPRFSSALFNCQRETDKFSVSNPKARLNYPVGLMTSSEVSALGNNLIGKTGSIYKLLNPYELGYNTLIYGYVAMSDGDTNRYAVILSHGVRPVIALKSGIKFSDGYGTMEEPYIVDTIGD